MNKITLNARELEKIYTIFNQMNESSEYGAVTLEQSDNTGIGSTLTATMYVTHREVEGDFTV